MNVYEAIAKSSIGLAWHKDSGIVTAADELVAYCAGQHPDGWQPLAALEDAEQWKQRAEKAEAELYTACQQLAGEYTLGEPLTEVAHERQHYIAVNKKDGRLEQGTFEDDFLPAPDYWTYYADPRPWPVLPEKKPRYTLRDCGEYFRILRDEKDFCVSASLSNAEAIVLLLNESEGE